MAKEELQRGEWVESEKEPKEEEGENWKGSEVKQLSFSNR